MIMIELIDNVLNRITMYRLVLYYLIFLVVAAVALSFYRLLPGLRLMQELESWFQPSFVSYRI
jgi:hypothetical protein